VVEHGNRLVTGLFDDVAGAAFEFGDADGTGGENLLNDGLVRAWVLLSG